MPTELPPLTYEQFRDRLLASASHLVEAGVAEAGLPEAGGPAVEELARTAAPALHLHYQELRRWSRRLSLVGPGTAEEVVERHYGEGLAGLAWIPAGAETLVDVGSGAGFPGVVLAAARPDLRVTLVEPRERRWAFLRAACRRAALPCRCLNARVGSPLPDGLPAVIDVVTMRALKLPPEAFDALSERFSSAARILLWMGGEELERPPRVREVGRSVVPSSERRQVVAWELADPPARAGG